MVARSTLSVVDEELSTILAILIEDGDEKAISRLLMAELEDSGLDLAERQEIVAPIVAAMLESV